MGRGAAANRSIFAAGAGRGVAAIRRALWRPAVGLRHGAACGWPDFFAAARQAVRPAWRLAQAFFAARPAGRWVRGVRCATNRTIFVAGLGRCARHGGWPKCFSRRGRRGGVARRVADRTLRSDVTGGRPRAVVLAIVRRGSCDCAPIRISINGQTGTRPPPVRAGGRALWDGGTPGRTVTCRRFMRLRAACHEPQFIRSCAVVHAPARRLTCGRAAAPAIVRRLPLRLRAAAHAGGRNETDKQETRPRPYGGGRALGRGASGRVFGRTFRGGAAGGAMGRGARPTGVFCGGDGRGVGCHTARALAARGRPAAGAAGAAGAVGATAGAAGGAMVRGVRCATNRTIFVAGRGGCARHGGWPQAFFATRQTGRWCAACGVRLTGLFSARGGARCGCHTARALAVRGRPAAWRGVWLARLFCGGAAGGAMGARRGGARFSHGGWGCRPVPAARRGRAGKTKTA